MSKMQSCSFMSGLELYVELSYDIYPGAVMRQDEPATGSEIYISKVTLFGEDITRKLIKAQIDFLTKECEEHFNAL